MSLFFSRARLSPRIIMPVVFPGSEKFFSNLCMSILSNDGFLNLLSFSLEVLSTDHLPDQTQVGHK